MKGTIRNTIIRIKLQEMTESVELVQEHLPESADTFRRLGLVKDGIYKVRRVKRYNGLRVK